MNIGEAIYKQRKTRHLRQEDVANHLHVSKSTFCNYENNVHEPTLDTLVCLADLFDVSTDYLLGRTDLTCSFSILNDTIDGQITYSSLIHTIHNLDKEDLLYFVRTCQLLKKNTADKSSPTT